MVDDNIALAGGLAAIGYFGFKSVDSAVDTAAAPANFAAETATGVFDFAGNGADGVTDAIGDASGFLGGEAADIIAAPGNVAEDAYGGAKSTLDNVGEAIGNLNPF